jgi:hypothetical protein
MEERYSLVQEKCPRLSQQSHGWDSMEKVMAMGVR